jgi:hypothetical protein
MFKKLFLITVFITILGICSPLFSQNKITNSDGQKNIATQLFEILNAGQIKEINIERTWRAVEFKIISNNILLIKGSDIVHYVNVGAIKYFTVEGKTLTINF